MGGSMSGSSRTGRRERPMRPKRTSTRFIIVARIGRWMETRESIMTGSRTYIRRGGLRWSQLHRGARSQFLSALHDHFLAVVQSLQNLRLAGKPMADLDGPHLGVVLVIHDEHSEIITVAHQRGLRDDDSRVAQLEGQVEAGEHPA